MKFEEVEFSRVKRSLNEAERYYSRLSKIYDWLAASEKKFINQGLDLLDPQPGEIILEIGFGTGFAQKRIIPKLSEGLSVGLDISSGMANVCQRNLIKAGYGHNQSLIISDTLPIPVKSGIFDSIFTSFTLELFDTPQIPKVFSECQRVLKPGGKLVIVSLSKDIPLSMMGRVYEKMHDHFPHLLDCRPIPLLQIIKTDDFEIKGIIHTKMWGLPVIILEATKISS
jgi:demethylmenaquinone methyltransferase/2-methoxy-6-polyprenyl-1,4-benzoquinol methylase